jgi:DNA-binding NtrC family response regulator
MPHILVIDDDDLIRSLVQRALVNAGYEVTLAPNGRKGLAAFQAAPADLVITDLVMPDMEGLEAIIEFRRRAPGLKIIAMSGGGVGWGTDYLKMAKKFGASGILNKPFELGELSDLVGKLLGGLAPTGGTK